MTSTPQVPRYTGTVHMGGVYQAVDGHRVTPIAFSVMGIVADMITEDGRATTITISRRSFATYKCLAKAVR